MLQGAVRRIARRVSETISPQASGKLPIRGFFQPMRRFFHSRPTPFRRKTKAPTFAVEDLNAAMQPTERNSDQPKINPYEKSQTIPCSRDRSPMALRRLLHAVLLSEPVRAIAEQCGPRLYGPHPGRRRKSRFRRRRRRERLEHGRNLRRQRLRPLPQHPAQRHAAGDLPRHGQPRRAGQRPLRIRHQTLAGQSRDGRTGRSRLRRTAQTRSLGSRGPGQGRPDQRIRQRLGGAGAPGTCLGRADQPAQRTARSGHPGPHPRRQLDQGRQRTPVDHQRISGQHQHDQHVGHRVGGDSQRRLGDGHLRFAGSQRRGDRHDEGRQGGQNPGELRRQRRHPDPLQADGRAERRRIHDLSEREGPRQRPAGGLHARADRSQRVEHQLAGRNLPVGRDHQPRRGHLGRRPDLQGIARPELLRSGRHRQEGRIRAHLDPHESRIQHLEIRLRFGEHHLQPFEPRPDELAGRQPRHDGDQLGPHGLAAGHAALRRRLVERLPDAAHRRHESRGLSARGEKPAVCEPPAGQRRPDRETGRGTFGPDRRQRAEQPGAERLYPFARLSELRRCGVDRLQRGGGHHQQQHHHL